MGVGIVFLRCSEVYIITYEVLSGVVDHTRIDAPVTEGIILLLRDVARLCFGFLGLGFILDYIPMPAILGYMLGAELINDAKQLPDIFSLISFFDVMDAYCLVEINFFKH